MRKIIFILLSVITLSANSQNKNSFKKLISNFDISCELGTIEGDFGVGLSASLFGVYFDYLVNPAAYEGTCKVGVWNDKRSNVYHVGIKVPINKYISITPIVGNYKGQKGKTNGYD